MGHLWKVGSAATAPISSASSSRRSPGGLEPIFGGTAHWSKVGDADNLTGLNTTKSLKSLALPRGLYRSSNINRLRQSGTATRSMVSQGFSARLSHSTACRDARPAVSAQKSALGFEADRISGLLAQTNNPVLVDCVTYLTRYLASTKRELLELLDLQRRSLIYTSLVPIQPTYRWALVADLLKIQGALDQALIDAAERRGRQEQVVLAEF